MDTKTDSHACRLILWPTERQTNKPGQGRLIHPIGVLSVTWPLKKPANRKETYLRHCSQSAAVTRAGRPVAAGPAGRGGGRWATCSEMTFDLAGEPRPQEEEMRGGWGVHTGSLGTLVEREREKKHNVNQFSSRCHRNRLRLHRANQQCAVHYMTSRYTSLHFITSHFITLHCVTLNFITLHYVKLHSISRCYVTRFITLHGIHSADKSLMKWNLKHQETRTRL